MDLTRIRPATQQFFDLLAILNISESDKLLLTKIMDNIATSAFIEGEYDGKQYFLTK